MVLASRNHPAVPVYKEQSDTRYLVYFAYVGNEITVVPGVYYCRRVRGRLSLLPLLNLVNISPIFAKSYTTFHLKKKSKPAFQGPLLQRPKINIRSIKKVKYQEQNKMSGCICFRANIRKTD